MGNRYFDFYRILQHAARVFQMLPSAEGGSITDNPKMAQFQALPSQFDRAKYINIASQMQIPASTAGKQIARFLATNLLVRQAHGDYSKK